MNIEPAGAPKLQGANTTEGPRPGGRVRSLSTTLSMTVAMTSRSSAGNIHGIAAIARSLSSAARELSHASGFAQQGLNANRHAEETLRAMQVVAQRSGSDTSPLERSDNKFDPQHDQNDLRKLRDTVSRLQASTFHGTPVFSSAALSAQVENANASAARALELQPSTSARAVLQDFAALETPTPEAIDRALDAVDTLGQEFDAAAQHIQGTQGAVAQQRLDALAIDHDARTEVETRELGRRVTSELTGEFRSAELLHARPESEKLLALLGDSEVQN